MPPLQELRATANFYAGLLRYALTAPKVNRDRAHVTDAYDPHWDGYSRYLDGAATIDEWLHIPANDSQAGYHNRDGRLESLSFDSVSFYRARIRNALRTHFPTARSVTEYGCGVGRNVLDLQHRFSDFRCYGYELSQKGADLGAAAAEKFASPARYAQLDYLRDGDDRFVHPSTDVAFTSFSLEQIPDDAHVALDRMLRRSHLGSIHLEPVPENYPPTVRALFGRVYSWKEGYLQSFDRIVSRLDGYDVTKEVLTTSHNPIMYPSLYVIKRR